MRAFFGNGGYGVPNTLSACFCSDQSVGHGRRGMPFSGIYLLCPERGATASESSSLAEHGRFLHPLSKRGQDIDRGDRQWDILPTCKSGCFSGSRSHVPCDYARLQGTEEIVTWLGWDQGAMGAYIPYSASLLRKSFILEMYSSCRTHGP